MKKIHSSEIIERAFEFEKFCAKVFKTIGFRVERHVNINNNEIDMIITSSGRIRIVVEIKYYRTRKPSTSMLERAIKHIKYNTVDTSLDNHLIIVNLPIEMEIQRKILIEYNTVLLDSNNLLYLIGGNEEVTDEYHNIMSDIPTDLRSPKKAKKIDLINIFNKDRELTNIENLKVDNKGEVLRNQFKKINCGREDFSLYEKICTDIIQYLFNENLTGWHKQFRTDDEINRYDLVCRVNRGNDFWEFLINEFHSRYIVFEFKNYCYKVKQTQVYTTEKYLFQKALRNVCFMISHQGLDDNAQAATKGILRESGKLIINLLDEDLKKMIGLKEGGDEPSDYLFEMVDNILLKLSK